MQRENEPEKRQWSLVPWQPLLAVVDVIMFGAKKHSPDGWKHIPDGRTQYMEACQRHLAAMFMGYDTDGESAMFHSAHLACNALFVLWYDLAPVRVGT